MEFKNFQELIVKVQNNNSKKRVAVVAAQDEHTLEAVLRARQDKLVEPVLIGDKIKITEILKGKNEPILISKAICKSRRNNNKS